MRAPFRLALLLAAAAWLCLLSGMVPQAGAAGLSETVHAAQAAGLSDAVVQRIFSLGYQYDLTAEEMADFIAILTAAGSDGLPIDALVDKISEGLAKRVEPKAVARVVSQRAERFRFVRTLALATLKRWGQPETSLAEADLVALVSPLSAGLGEDQMRRVMELAPRTALPELAESLEFLAVILDAGLPEAQGRELVLKGLSNGFFSGAVWDLARAVVEAKRRGAADADIVRQALSVVNGTATAEAAFASLGVAPETYDAGPKVIEPASPGAAAEPAAQSGAALAAADDAIATAADLVAGNEADDETTVAQTGSGTDGTTAGTPGSGGSSGASGGTSNGSSGGSSSSGGTGGSSGGSGGGSNGGGSSGGNVIVGGGGQDDPDLILAESQSFNTSGLIVGFNEAESAVLRTAAGLVVVEEIGPATFWANLGIDQPVVGDTVTVDGHVDASGDSPRKVAFRLSLGESVVVLRDPENGKPFFTRPTGDDLDVTLLDAQPFTVTGRIAAVRSLDGAFLLEAADGGHWSIEGLGPADFWQKNGLTRPEAGAQVTVSGFSRLDADTTRHVAFRVALDGGELALRDVYTGLPLWQDASLAEDPNQAIFSGRPFAAEGMVVDQIPDGVVMAAAEGDLAITGLGPAAYWQGLGLTPPAIGDFLSAQGFVLGAGLSERYLAVSMVKDGETVNLRDAVSGVPLWTGGADCPPTRLACEPFAIEGTVTSVAPDGSMVVATADTKWTVYGLAPYRHWQSLRLPAPAIGDTVRVEGYLLDQINEQRALAYSLSLSGGATVSLRQATTGLPVW